MSYILRQCFTIKHQWQYQVCCIWLTRIAYSPQMNDTSFLLCLYCFQLHNPIPTYSHFYSISSDQSGVLSTGCYLWAIIPKVFKSLGHMVNYNFQSFHILYPREILDSNGNWPKHNFTKRFILCMKEILLYYYLGLQEKKGSWVSGSKH